MKLNKRTLRKYTAILALAISAVMFLPEALFAQGAVIGYAAADGVNVPPNNWNPFPPNVQLEKLTHVIAMDVYPDANGNLKSNLLPVLKPNKIWTTNMTDAWLADLVSRAKQRGVIVSIGISGVGSASSYGYGVGEFVSATSPAKLTAFVGNIVAME